VVIGYGYFSGRNSLRAVRIESSWAKALPVAACSLTKVIFVQKVAGKRFAGGEEERYFAPLNDAQGGGPAGDQSSRDGGVVPKHKVPGEFVPRVGSSRWFPGECLK